MAFQRLYTGQGTGVKLPSGERLDRGQERLSDLILDADRVRYDAFQKNKEWFLRSTDVPVESFLSAANTETQAKLLNDYNTEVTKIVKDRGGLDKLTWEDQAKIARGRQQLEGEQQRMLADLQKYQMANKLVQQNPQLYDREKFHKDITLPYMDKGRFPDLELPLRPESADLYLNAHKIRGAGAWSETKPIVGNPEKEQTTEYSARLEDIAPTIVGLALKNPQYMEEAKADWEALSPQEKESFFNPENDTVKRYAKLGITNPILMNYADRHWKSGVAVSMTDPKFRNRSSGIRSGMERLNFLGLTGAYKPTEASSQTIGNTLYEKYHAVTNIPVGDIPIKSARILAKGGDVDEVINSTVTVDLTGYDEVRDEFTFLVKGDYLNADSSVPMLRKGKDRRLAVKRTELPPQYNEFKIMKNGKPVKVGDISRPTSEGVSTPKMTMMQYKAKYGSTEGYAEYLKQ